MNTDTLIKSNKRTKLLNAKDQKYLEKNEKLSRNFLALAEGVRNKEIDPLEAFNEMKNSTMKLMIEFLLEAEADAFIQEDIQRGNHNKRNGYTSKKITLLDKDVEISKPRDRNSSIDSKILPKYSKSISNSIRDQVHSFILNGATIAETTRFINEIYSTDFSQQTINNIGKELHDKVQEYLNESLQRSYMVVFFDALHKDFKFDGRYSNIDAERGSCIYFAIGIDWEGRQTVLGWHYGKGSENKTGWRDFMLKLKYRGLEKIFISVSDGLPGMSDLLEAQFPGTRQQRCIVHLLRNVRSKCPSNIEKIVLAELKKVYQSPTEEEAYIKLCELRDNDEILSNKRLKNILIPWFENWEYVSTFLKLPIRLRKTIYTTNVIENFNSVVRKQVRKRGQLGTEYLDLIIYAAIKGLNKKGKQNYYTKIRNGFKYIILEIEDEYRDEVAEHYKLINKFL